MAYRVKDAIELSLIINGLEYPLSAGNSLNFLHIAAGTKMLLPSLHFSVVDVTNSMSKMGITDASPIQVILSCDGVVTARNFRVNNWFNPPGSEIFNIDGFWDSPRYRTGTVGGAIGGTSNMAMTKIAEACGLGYDGVITNDPQVWLPRNRTFGEFAAYIARHGYIGDQSHLIHVIDSLGVLRYKDARAVERLFLGAYGYVADKAYRIQEFQPSAKSGVNNALGGYRKTRVAQSVFSDTKLHETLSFQPDSKNVLLSKEARELQGRGSFSYSPIDFGNTHESFQQAQYQNHRFDSLKSLSCEFMIFNPTKMEPLDSLNFTTEPSSPSQYDGAYSISHKVIYIQGNTYAEKFVGLREGLS